MSIHSLVEKMFQENELYELLLFDIEANFEQYYSQFIHIYFNRVENDKIKVIQIVYFNDDIAADTKSRSIIEKNEWFEIVRNHDHINFLLCRFYRTGYVSSIWKDHTRTQNWSHGWADERPDLGPMSPEEIQQAVLELSGFFQINRNYKNQDLKKPFN